MAFSAVFLRAGENMSCGTWDGRVRGSRSDNRASNQYERSPLSKASGVIARR